MDFSTIETSVRRTLDDNSVGDKLWSQEEILEYARDAENEACERADLIIDSTSGLTNLGIVGSVGTYGLAVTITNILSIKPDDSAEPLMETSERILDNTVPSWRTEAGTPRSFVRTPTNSIIIYPIPVTADTVQMTVSRFPNIPMTTNGSPEIDARYHAGLIEWILHRAYMKNDSETLNVDKANDHALKFEAYFGKKKILND
jgi:hypothetical protein